MELYPWIVLVHVIAAFLFILAHGASAIVSFRLRAERDPTRILALLDLSASTIGPMYGTLGLLLLAGIAAGIMGNWFSKGWIWLALGIFVVITVLMYVVATTLRRHPAGARPGPAGQQGARAPAAADRAAPGPPRFTPARRDRGHRRDRPGGDPLAHGVQAVLTRRLASLGPAPGR
jgi:hypothetical protein